MYTEKVRVFAEKASPQKKLPKTPQRLDEKAIAFLKQMVLDELSELEEAETIADQADALVDAIYYILHSAATQGINLDPIFSLVHKANMNKVTGKVRFREDGKIMKPEGWQHPHAELAEEIERQNREGAF